jgi:hypothetical protein
MPIELIMRLAHDQFIGPKKLLLHGHPIPMPTAI